MSSSKIIKLADHDRTGVADFSFGVINSSLSVAPSAGSGFTPMGLFQGEQYGLGAESEADAVPLVEISEDELGRRLSDSFSAGLKEGKELAERGLLNVFRALRASSEAIHDLREKVFRESEDELVHLVMDVARKVIVQEVVQDPTIVANVVKQALAGLSVRDEVTVRINPDDYHLVTSGRDDLLQRELLNERLSLKPDPTVVAGFCLVDTAMGTIDASLDGQLEQLYRTLLEQRSAMVSEDVAG